MPPAADPPTLVPAPTSRRSPATSTAPWSRRDGCSGPARSPPSPARGSRNPGDRRDRDACSARCGPISSEAGISDPVVCYQGAAVVDPRSGDVRCSTSRSRSRRRARSDRACSTSSGYPPNCYVDDRLFVGRAHRVLADVLGLPAHPGRRGRRPRGVARRRRRRSSSPSPTRPSIPARSARRSPRRSGDRLFLTTSLPYLLELGNPAVSKGTGIAFVAEQLGISIERDRLVRGRRERHRADRRGRLRDRGRGREPAAARARRLDLPERRARRVSPP